MNSWKKETTEKVEAFFHEYGKVFVVGVSFSVSLLSVCLIVSLITPHKLRVSFLDIGQGDAILIQTPGGHDMLIDGGPSNAVLEQLAERVNYFDRSLDVMIATHGDSDHITGLIPVMGKYKVKTIVRSPIKSNTGVFENLERDMTSEGADIRVGKKGDEIDFGDGVIAYVLYPNGGGSPSSDTNNSSVSVVVKYGEHSFLLSGDLTAKYEPYLIQSALPKHVTVYKAGHHGSKTSSGEQLLTYIKPEYAVISAGKDNKYGHPNPEAVSRLEKYAKEILSTIDRGTITFASDGRVMEVETGK